MGVDPVDIAVGVDQLGCRLLPHPGDTWQVVGGVTPQRRVLGVPGGRDSGAGLDARLVVVGVVGDAPLVVDHPDVGVLDELVGVAIARDDEHVVPSGRSPGGQGGQHVISLEARSVDQRDVQGLDELTGQAHLLAQDVWRLGPSSLVTGDHLVAEGGLGPVEADHQLVRVLVSDQVDQHRHKPVHRVGHLPGRSGQIRGQGKERPIEERVAVDQHETRHQDRA